MERLMKILIIVNNIIILKSEVIPHDSEQGDLLFRTRVIFSKDSVSSLTLDTIKTTHIDMSEEENNKKTWMDEILKDMERTKNLNIADNNVSKETKKKAEVMEKRHELMKKDSSGIFCSKFSNCIECHIAGHSVCKWCHDYGCVSASSEKCLLDINAKNNPISDPCPKIYHDSHIIIPSGVRTDIVVKINAPDPAIFDSYVMCQISFKNRITHLKAQIIKDKIYCYPLQLDLSNLAAGSEYGVFKVLWGGFSPVSNDIGVEVYNCGTLAYDCESCRVVQKEYGCGWCEQLHQCVIEQKCKSDYMKWTISRLTCRDMKAKFVFA